MKGAANLQAWGYGQGAMQFVADVECMPAHHRIQQPAILNVCVSAEPAAVCSFAGIGF